MLPWIRGRDREGHGMRDKEMNGGREGDREGRKRGKKRCKGKNRIVRAIV
jgi:hypothetical protein